MSMSPDDPSFLDRLQQSLGQGINSPLMGLAAGLLNAAGPSRMPVSLGQALGQGLQTGQQFQSTGLQNAMQQLQLGRQMQLNKMLANPNPNDPSWMANFALASGHPEEASSIYAQTGDRPMTDAEIQKFYGGRTPGMAYFYNDYTHKPSTSGESAIKTVQTMTPAGTMATVPYDVRTGQIKDVGGVLNTVDYTQPLKDKTQEDLAQRIAAGMQAPPTVSSRNPGAAQQLARADAILKEQGQPGYDASTWPAKQKAVSYWNTGKGAQQVTAFNAAESHLETLKPLIDNLDNTNTPVFNRIKNYFAKETGSTAPTNFAAAKQYVGGELAKVVVGSGGTITEGDRKEAADILASANTPEQLKQAIAQIQNLIGGKMLALKTQYNNSGLGNFEHRLEGPALNAMNGFEQTQTQAPAASTNGGYTLPPGYSISHG